MDTSVASNHPAIATPEHPLKVHVKKHVHWYWLVLYLLFFIGIPVAAALFATPSSYYFRIVQTCFFWLFCIGFSLYGIFASRQAYFRKKKEEFTIRHEILIIVCRIFYVVWLCAGLYYLGSTLNGIYQKFILQKPYELIDDTVVYAHSTGGRYAHSDGNCRYMFCQLKLQGNPTRELEYDDPPYIQQGNIYQFVILPGSNLIVGSSDVNM